MDYSKQVEKLKKQMTYWNVMVVAGLLCGIALTIGSTVLLAQGAIDENETTMFIGSLLSMFSTFPFDAMIAGIILKFVWRRRIANYESHMDIYHNNEYQDYHDYSIPEEDKIKKDPLSDYTNKDDPFH